MGCSIALTKIQIKTHHIHNKYSASSPYQIKIIIKILKATKGERKLHTIYENLSRRLEYRGLELEDGTKKPHCGKPIWELALCDAAPENQNSKACSCQVFSNYQENFHKL